MIWKNITIIVASESNYVHFYRNTTILILTSVLGMHVINLILYIAILATILKYDYPSTSCGRVVVYIVV